MLYKDMLIGIFMFSIAHVLTFFQLNGQFFKTDWFRKNEIVVACFGVIISFLFIWGTKYTVTGMGGLMWPSRFIGFGIGMVIYAIFINHHFNEGMNSKTWVSLGLAVMLICIQVFWKTK